MADSPTDPISVCKYTEPDPKVLSKYQKWHLTITTIGVFVAALALGLVWWQVIKLGKQIDTQTDAINLQKQALESQNKILIAQKLSFDAQAWQTINTQQLAVAKAMVEHPEVMPYFFDGMPIKRDDKKFNLVMAIADLHLDFIDGFDNKYITALDGMGPKGEYWILWENYFVDSFSNSPALCMRYDQLKRWYVKGVGEYAKAGCKK